MRSSKFVAALVGALGIAAISCSDDSTSTNTAAPTTAGAESGVTTDASQMTAQLTAADLRSQLTVLLNEPVILAADATNAALGARTDEYDAAVAELDRNSEAIATAVGSVYGDGAGQAFLPLWRKHIGFFVDYTTALGAEDQAAADTAVAALTAYAGELAVFFNSANPDLPKDTVSELVTDHILTLKAVVDAQAAGNQAEAYQNLGTAMGHMRMIADPLAAAISQAVPRPVPRLKWARRAPRGERHVAPTPHAARPRFGSWSPERAGWTSARGAPPQWPRMPR